MADFLALKLSALLAPPLALDKLAFLQCRMSLPSGSLPRSVSLSGLQSSHIFNAQQSQHSLRSSFICFLVTFLP